jgi:transmembrane sensor
MYSHELNLAADDATRQAACWMLELESPDLTDERLAAWQAWLSADTRNQHAFDRLQKVQECIRAARQLPWPSDEEVAADSRRMTWSSALLQTTHRYRLALAASIAAVAIGMATWIWIAEDLRSARDESHVIRTTIGELRRVPLEDGSTLTLGGLSRIEVQFDPGRRDVRLEQGEAFFEVAKDPARPFVVHSGDIEIKAIGTAFNVRQLGKRTVVSVSEGIVEARHGDRTARLAAGEQMRLGQGDSEPEPVAMARGTVGAWRAGQRQYRAEPLADVVADLERYSMSRIVIEDEHAARLTITATVFERDIDKWLVSLGSALPVRVDTDADGTVRIASEE